MTVRVDQTTRKSNATVTRPTARPGNLVQALLAGVVALEANLRLRRAGRRFRAGHAPPVPTWLREDVGLPPAGDQLPSWWEQRWR